MPDYDALQFDPPAPLATVTLQTRDRARSVSGVLMLIDSGSDVTLIPESAARRLGFGTGDQKDYEVAAFDGAERIAKCVECGLIFLRRAFWGVYLLGDAPVGILGRDVLNHVCLILDGPARNWREEHLVE